MVAVAQDGTVDMTHEENMEAMARRIFMAAMQERRCGELLDALFDGASATVGPDGVLVIMPGDLLATMLTDPRIDE